MSSFLVIFGPSGSGKSSLLRRLLNEFSLYFQFSVSHTTRKKRFGEINGKEYHFIGEEVFKEMIKSGKFLEFTRFGTNYYGTSFQTLNEIKKSGKIAILDLELNGVLKVKKMNEFKAKYLLIRTKSLDQLEKNLRNRGTEDENEIRRRMERAKEDMEVIMKDNLFDKEIINEDFEESFEEMKKWLKLVFKVE